MMRRRADLMKTATKNKVWQKSHWADRQTFGRSTFGVHVSVLGHEQGFGVYRSVVGCKPRQS